jgi:hypothetical protein
MTGPLGFSWLTFGAFLVVAASIVVSVLWAIRESRSGAAGRADGREDGGIR